MGVTGTGKSTIARGLADALGWRLLEGDDLHSSASVERMRGGQPLTDTDRWPWLLRIAEWIGRGEAAGLDAVVTCSALRRSYRDILRQGHPSVWFAHLTVSPDMLAERLRLRQGHFMPASLLDSQLADVQPLGPDEPGVTVRAEATPPELLAHLLGLLHPAGPR